MTVYDLQGLGTGDGSFGVLGSNASSVGCCVPSAESSTWSIFCRDC